MIFGASFSPTIAASASTGAEARSPKPSIAFSTKSAPCLSAYFAERRRKRRTFWMLTGSVMETANAVCPSTSSRKRTRFAQGSAVKSTLPFLKTNSRAELFLAMLARGQMRSTDPRLRLFNSPLSGSPVISQSTSRTSISRFVVFAAMVRLPPSTSWAPAHQAPRMSSRPTLTMRLSMRVLIWLTEFREIPNVRATSAISRPSSA